MEAERPAAFGGAEAQIEKLDQCIELVVDERFVERGEGDGLGEAGAGLDEDELGLRLLRAQRAA